MLTPSRWTPRRRVVMLAVTALSAAWLARHLNRGWIPHDEGSLAQAAERVLQGELPHRDFDDVYTGGLAMLDALGFRVLGTTLLSMRLVLLAAFVGWVPAVYAIASRVAGPLAAGGVTLLAVAWGVPNYVAPMPSWYNLFLATWGIAALLRFIDAPRARWLFVAGVCGGLSLLVKVVGLYYVAGVLLFLVFHAHERARAEARDAARATGYALFVSAALAAFVAALALLLRHAPRAPEVVQFLLPGALLAALLARDEWREPAGPSRARFLALLRLGAPFLLGVALPVALFLVPYVASGAVGALLNGVFVLPTRRFGFATAEAPSLLTMLALVPVALVVSLGRRAAEGGRRWEWPLLAAAVVALVVLTGMSDPLYRGVWYSARALPPVLVAAAVLALARRDAGDAADPRARERLMLLASVTALCALVQFPFVVPIYFCYVAPLVALTAAALAPRLRPVRAGVLPAIAAFYLLFAAVRMNDSSLFGMGNRYLPYFITTPLPVDRAGIGVLRFQARDYGQLVALLRQHARGGYTWASPDAPELYFLAGLRNPTRSLFEFFDEPDGREARVLDALDAHGVTVIAINRKPDFSAPVSDAMLGELERRYPHAAEVDKFLVRWR